MLDGVRVHLVDDVDTAAEFLRWLSARDRIAIDTETHGLNRWQMDRVRLIQFADHHEAWCIEWEQWRALAIDALRRFRGRMVFFNAKFDVPMIEASGGPKIDTSRVDDTMIKAHIHDPTGRHALKILCMKYIDRNAALAQRQLDEAMVDNNWTWATIPTDFPLYWLYGGMDACMTLHLDDFYAGKIAARSYDLEMASVWIARNMEDHGARIDQPYTQACLSNLEEWLDTTVGWYEEQFGFGPGSDVKLIELFESKGHRFTKLTDSGQRFSLDKTVLEPMAVTDPLAASILQYRRTQKLCGTYLHNFLQDAVDGYLHPNIHTMMSEKGGAVTGRMSITQPALQTLPRKSEANPLSIMARNCFIPSEGNVLVLCDFDQIEARMFAHLTKDPAMIAAFDEGDFFVNMARMIYNDPSIVKSDVRRQWTKNAIYTIAYGGGVDKLAVTAGITGEDAQSFMDRLHGMFAGIKRFQREVDQVSKQRLRDEGMAYVLSPLTGRMHVSKNDKEYALVNYLIQGTAAEVFKRKLLELDAAGLGEYMVLPVHDEIIMDVPRDIAEDVAHTTKQVMSDDELFSVRLTAGVDIAERWGAKV